jgi:hypothetical protein
VESGAAIVDHRCVKAEEHAVPAGHSVNPARWQEAFEGLMSPIAGRFTRVESRRRARKLVLGLLSDLPRKNCRTIAGRAGDRSSWSRWVTLAMLAHAFLAVVRANEHDRHPSPDGLLPLSCNEIQRLFITLVIQRVLDPVHQLGWSVWRRRHQARSQTSHCRRQAAQA